MKIWKNQKFRKNSKFQQKFKKFQKIQKKFKKNSKKNSRKKLKKKTQKKPIKISLKFKRKNLIKKSHQMENSTHAKDWSQHKFILPTKQIITPEDVERFKKTKIFAQFMTFIQELQKSVESKSKSSTSPNPKFSSLVLFLETIDLLINEIPPLQQQMRYGNKAFRTWHERVQLVKNLAFSKKISFFSINSR